MVTQKLYKNGNSVAVTVPKPYLKQLNLRDGSKVVLTVKNNGLIVSKANAELAPNVDIKFVKMVDEFISEHEDVLKELAKR